jgi:hypothetical protein
VLPSWFEDVQKQIVANEFVLQQYQNLVTQAGFSKSGEAVARKKDSIVSLIGTGSWGNRLNFCSSVTVAVSHHLSHDDKQSVLSLGKYLESQIEQDIKGDECLTFITRTFLTYLVVPQKDEGILHTIPHTIPTVSEYKLIEDVVTNFKSRSVIKSFGKKKKTAGLSYLEKYQIERLLTLIGSVDIQLLNQLYISEICKSKEKKSDL